MDNNHLIGNVFSYQNDLFDELFCTNTLVNMIKTSCQNREFGRQYYGINNEMSKKLSEERNEYIAMLTLISDKLSTIIDLNLSIEQKLSLQKNTNNCGR